MSISKDNKLFNYAMLRANITGGYGSMWDAQEVTFDLCESCIAKLMKTFKIKAEVTNVPI